jgi:hypothetical protein
MVQRSLIGAAVRLALVLAVLAVLLPAPPVVRAQADAEPDYAVPLIYAIPKDGEDRGLDQDGTILGSVESAQRWLEEQTGGRRLNLVTDRRGTPTVEFLELTRTEAELHSWPDSSPSFQIEYEARAAGFNTPGVLNAIYFDGADVLDGTCGETPWPVYTPGNSFTLFILGGCADFEILGAEDEAGWWELTFMHEFFHAIGAVEPCAPNGTDGHSDETNDLMYGGTQPWVYPVLLDVDNDDYFGHGRNACYDGARSPYLVPHGDLVEPYPSPFIELEMLGCSFESGVIVEENELAEVWIFNLSDTPIEIVWFDEQQEPDSLGMINEWDGGIFTSLPGDVLHVLDASGECIGSYEMPNVVEIGTAWVMTD